MLGDGLRSRQRERVRRGERSVVGGERAPGFCGAWVQPPLVQVFAALAAFVDAGEDAVVGDVEQRLGLLNRRSAHPCSGCSWGNGRQRVRQRTAPPRRVAFPFPLENRTHGEQPESSDQVGLAPGNLLDRRQDVIDLVSLVTRAGWVPKNCADNPPGSAARRASVQWGGYRLRSGSLLRYREAHSA